MAVRIISTAASVCWNRVITSAYRFQILHASSQGIQQQNDDQAFWDIEGSKAVVPREAGDLGCLKTTETKIRTTEAEPSHEEEPREVLRKTKFGYIRLDKENPAVETIEKETKDDSEKFNYIDNQFFGNTSLSEPSSIQPSQKTHSLKASHVPIDTNPIDQQYFYPNSSPEEKEDHQLVTSSASELEFKENEIDDQYFGKKTTPATKPKTPPSKVSAYEYLRNIQAKSATNVNLNEVAKPTGSDDDPIPTVTYADMVPELFKMPNDLIVNLLKRNILYNKDGLVVLNKPYGLVTTDSDGKSQLVLTNFLPALSKALRVEKLYTVHRLDRDTTGILLLASNQEVANRLNKLFLDHLIIKKYLAITKGVPSPREGTIDIPICEQTMGNRQRMTIRPVLGHGENSNQGGKYNTKVKSFKAITDFRVLRFSGLAAFVELEPKTGVRHQLRVHLSHALNCPVLADHKYSHDDKFAPQKLPQDMLERLNVKQSKVRNIPMHLHAASVCIPGFGENGKDLNVFSPLPAFFRYTLKKLKLKQSR